MGERSSKVAVITGASRGLGRGMAESFAREGVGLGLCARTEPEAPEGGEAVTASVDVRDPDAVDGFARAVRERFGRIDLWINNAGVLEPIRPLRDIESEEMEQHLAINVLGVFHGSRTYVRSLREAGETGVLVNVSSGAARHPYAGWSAYCAGKAAVDRMTEVVALEEKDVVRAYAVAPGVIDTDMQTLIRSKSEDEFPMVERFREMKEQEAFTTSEEVAAGMLRLAFDEPFASGVLIDLRDV